MVIIFNEYFTQHSESFKWKNLINIWNSKAGKSYFGFPTVLKQSDYVKIINKINYQETKENINI